MAASEGESCKVICSLGLGNGVGKQGRGKRPHYRRYGPLLFSPTMGGMLREERHSYREELCNERYQALLQHGKKPCTDVSCPLLPF